MKTWNVQLAHNINDHPIAPGEWFTLTQKLNGIRGTFYRGEIIGRNGTHYAGLEHIEKVLAPFSGLVFDGEITLADPGPLTDSEAFRAAAGLVRRKSGDKSNLALTIFDVISVDEFESGASRTTYRARREQLDALAAHFADTPAVRVLPTLYQGCDASVIPQLLRQMTAEGKEGLIANLDAPYQRRRTSGILKIKQFHTMDLPILRCVPGTGELSGTLGSLIVDFKGNEVGVGVGFTMEERDDLWSRRDTLCGKLVEVKYKEVSSNAYGGQSLQFPVFLTIREDKTEVSYGPAMPLRILDILNAGEPEYIVRQYEDEIDGLRRQVDELQATLSAKNKQIKSLVDRLNEQPDPQPQEIPADIQPQDKAAALVDKLAALPNVTATVKGAQTAAPVVWLSGDTDAHKDEIEKMGGKWSGKRGAWYFKIA